MEGTEDNFISLNTINTFLLTVVLALLGFYLFGPKKVPSEASSPRSGSFHSSSSDTNLLQYSSDMQTREIYRIVITGGPCAGKTTALSKVASEMRERGFNVFIVPEAATLLMKGGALINLESIDAAGQIEFQTNLMHLQMALEDTFTEIASSTKRKSIILCDRGLMDGSAYIPSELWQALLDERGWTAVHLRDRRYEAVIHMVTAANGAEDYYTFANNEARYEGLESARQVDYSLQESWIGHPHFTIIDNFNSKDFKQKIDRCVQHVCRYVGIPVPTQYFRKYLVKNESFDEKDIPSGIKHVKIYIEEVFLSSTDDIIDKIQKRGQSGCYIYTHVIRNKEVNYEYSVSKCQITSQEYMKLIKKKDPTRKPVRRVRRCFIFKGEYFTLDYFSNVKNGLWILRVASEKDEKDIMFPPFVEVIRNIKDDPGYNIHKLAKLNWYPSHQDKHYFMEDY
mmetsp:Transcript_8527/g.12616  ORF Transcript_8527/g.12616 Transcript_8527/m.12616 type:complete len:453 (-) Transcript_8527:1380-2738(-)